MSVIGVDEVGRGCLAGDMLVVAARTYLKIPFGLKDSKQLSSVQREFFYKIIKDRFEIGEGWVKVSEIDNLGLTEATKLGVKRALGSISAKDDDKIIIDGHINYAPKKFYNSQSIIKADNFIPEVSAASIYAKVTRDAYMQKISQKHQGYGFDKNMGYGTKFHIDALKLLGAIDSIHRSSFISIKNLAGS